MANYTTLERAEILRLMRNYELGPLLHFEPLAGGKANSSILISTGKGRFVFSVCDEKEAWDISNLTSILEYLEGHGFPTTRIVRTASGRPIIALGKKPAYLKEYIEGRVENNLSPSMVHQVGAVLARLHRIPPHRDLPGRFAYGIDSFGEIFDANIRGEYPEWLRRKIGAIGSGCPNDLPKGFIHGDLFSDNMLFSEGDLVAILDFEEACNYFLLFDLGMCAAGCCTLDGRFSLDLAAALIRGYQSIRKLELLEHQLFQLQIEYAAVATSFWRYRQYNLRYPESGHCNLYKEMTDLADEVRAIPQDVFRRRIFF